MNDILGFVLLALIITLSVVMIWGIISYVGLLKQKVQHTVGYSSTADMACKDIEGMSDNGWSVDSICHSPSGGIYILYQRES